MAQGKNTRSLTPFSALLTEGNRSAAVRSTVPRPYSPRELVVRGHAEAPTTQRVVVAHVGAGFSQMARRDIIGKQSRQPQGVVAEVHHNPEAAVALRGLEVGQDVHEVLVPLVVVPVDAPRPVSLPEVEQQGGQVVRQIAVVDAGPPQRVTDHHVKEERLRRHQHGAHREQSLQQLGRVEQRVGALGGQAALQRCATVGRAPAQQQDHQLQVGRGQSSARIRPNHG